MSVDKMTVPSPVRTRSRSAKDAAQENKKKEVKSSSYRLSRIFKQKNYINKGLALKNIKIIINIASNKNSTFFCFHFQGVLEEMVSLIIQSIKALFEKR